MDRTRGGSGISGFCYGSMLARVLLQLWHRAWRKNAPKAVELYIQALELDEDILWDDPADLGSESQRVQWNLGQIYEHGKPGVAVNKTEALKWYQRGCGLR